MPLAHAYTSTLIREAMPSHRRKACNLIRAMAEDLEMPTTCSSAALYIYHAYRSRREDSSEATTSNDSSSSHPKVAVEVHAQRTHGPSPSLFVQTAWLCGLLTHHTHPHRHSGGQWRAVRASSSRARSMKCRAKYATSSTLRIRFPNPNPKP
jgi:hypothetical protein